MALPRAKSLIGSSVQNGEFQNHIHTNNKNGLSMWCLYLCIHIHIYKYKYMYVTVMTKGRVEGTWERWEREGTWKGREYYLILFQLKIYLRGGTISY